MINIITPIIGNKSFVFISYLEYIYDSFILWFKFLYVNHLSCDYLFDLLYFALKRMKGCKPRFLKSKRRVEKLKVKLAYIFGRVNTIISLKLSYYLIYSVSLKSF